MLNKSNDTNKKESLQVTEKANDEVTSTEGEASKTLFVGSIPYELCEKELRALFSLIGTVESVSVIMDHEKGHNKGFGFVEMASSEQAKVAIEKLNGSTLGRRTIFVAQAKPKNVRQYKFC